MTRRIESAANPTIKGLARLLERRHRTEQGRFLIEGRREVGRALVADVAIESVLVCPEIAGDPGIADAWELSAAAFRKLSVRRHPDGVIAVARMFALDLETAATTDLILIAEAMEKPGNIGAMLRTADAVGASFVMADAVADVFNPGVIRASQGSLFSVPVAAAPAAAVRSRLEHSHHLLVADPAATTTLWDADLAGPSAIVIGSEHAGAGDAWDGTDRVSIPMSGSADSLNASVSAAILLYEAMRRRSS